MKTIFPKELLRESVFLLAPLWAVVFSVNMIYGSYVMSGKQVYFSRMGHSFNRDTVEIFDQVKSNADVSMVVMGNSRLRNAYAYGFDPKKIELLPDGRTLSSLQFADNAALFDYYADMSLWLLKARPDVLIIQNSVISNNLAYNTSVIDASDRVFNYFRSLVMEEDAYQDWYRTRNTLVGCPDRIYNKAMADRHMGFLRRFKHSLGEENQSYARARSFIDNALKLGITVVVLDLKPRVSFFSKFGIEEHQVDFYDLGHYPSREELLPEVYDKVLWWSYEEKNEDNFCDYLHFNEGGRDNFTDWLVQKLADTAEK